MRVSRGVIPPEGWQFQFNNLIIGADNIDTLVKRVEAYLVNNGLPIGETERAIHNQICKKYPHYCQEEDSDIKHKEAMGTHLPLAQRVSNWVSRTRSCSLQYVSPEEAARRASICENCPKNTLIWESGCGACSESSKSIAFTLRKGQYTANNSKLGACEILGSHIETSCFVHNQESLSSDMEASLPQHCWRRGQGV